MPLSVSVWISGLRSAGSVAQRQVGDATYVGIASGSESGFDVDFEKVGGPALGFVFEQLAKGGGTSAEGAVRALPEWIGETFPEHPSDPLLGPRLPSVEIMVAAITRRDVKLAWAGGGRALLLSRTSVIRQTPSQTLGAERAELDGAAPHVLNVPTQVITREAAPVTTEHWDCEPGCRLVVLPAPLLRRCDWYRGIPSQKLVRCANAEQVGALADASTHSDLMGGVVFVGWDRA